MKTKLFFLKKGAIVLFTILLLLLGLPRVSAQVTLTTFNLKIEDGSSKLLYIKDFKTMIPNASHTSLTAYTKSGDSITGIVGFTFSNDVITDVNSPNMISEVSVYPNPSDGNFTVKANVKASDVSLQLISMNGQIIKNVVLANQPTDFIYQFNQNLKTGAYVCRIKTDNGVFSQKIIIK